MRNIRIYSPLIPLITMLAASMGCAHSSDSSVSSPDGSLTVEFSLSQTGAPLYEVLKDGAPVLEASRLGLVRDDANFSEGLTLAASSKVESVEDRYEILTAKRRNNFYQANRKEFSLETKDGKKIDVIFQVSNDGVALRYHFPETSSETHTVKEEVTSFNFAADSKAWLQPMSVAKTGWAKSNPSYEEFYEKEIPVGTPSNHGAGWVFPALFNTGQTWCILSETGLERNYAGARLAHTSPDGEYSIGFPDPRETRDNLPVIPSSTLPWTTPWRLIAIGNLKTVTESTLGIDLATPAKSAPNAPTIQPGKASWSWPLNGDDKTVYDVQVKYIDYAADMGWQYCLVDALWDTQIGYDRIEELVRYAKAKNVDLLLWYNSAGDWNDTHQTPRSMMLTRESRVREFERIHKMGIKGVKVDFFGGDGQPFVQYYIDILEDAAPFGLLINFHGCTLPRGWQRTYPHLMTVEAIRGFEFMTFFQETADAEPSHSAMLPFTRNVFDPMDFTPLAPGSDRIGGSNRVSTGAFELALTVIFTSGIQHYPETPEGMARIPDYAKEFLKHVPSIWEDTKFIDGYPGKFVVLARKGDDHWYIAGINGENNEKSLTLDLSELGLQGAGQLITDGQDGFVQDSVTLDADQKLTLNLKPNGGFVLVF